MAYLKLSEQFFSFVDGFTVVEIANCLGFQNIEFLKDPADRSSKVERLQFTYRNGKHFSQFKNPLPKGQDIYIVAESAGFSAGGSSDDLGRRSQFLVKAYQLNEPFSVLARYKPENEFPTWTFNDNQPQLLQLAWHPLLDFQNAASP